MNSILSLIKKDLKIEFRSKDTLLLYSVLGILLSAVIASGVSSAFIDRASVKSLFPSLLWMVFILAGSFSVSKIQEFEFQHAAYQRLLVMKVDIWKMFISKVISGTIVISIGFAVSSTALSVLLNVPILSSVFGLAILGLLAAFGFASLSVLLSCIGLRSRMSSLLLPLMILPLLFPMFFALTELSSLYILKEAGFFSSIWFTLLLGLDVLYAVLGAQLYQFVLKD